MQPDHIGHYQILELLGEGGTGVVYRARDTRMQRLVAIKVLHPQLTKDPKDAARFQREVRLAASLRHPNVLTVYDCSPPESETCYLVTELVTGGSLRERVAGGLCALEVGLLLLPVTRALGAAHRGGIVHRDVKPDNILLDDHERELVVKLMDFGVALAQSEPRITTDKSVSGSIAYMAPEVLREGLITPAADIWSLGMTFFELLQGKHPFGQRQVGPLVRQILGEPPRLTSGSAPAPLVHFVSCCLERDRTKRYGSGEAAAAALSEALAASGLGDPDQELQRWACDPGYRVTLRARIMEAAVSKGAKPTTSWLLPALVGVGAGLLVGIVLMLRACFGR